MLRRKEAKYCKERHRTGRRRGDADAEVGEEGAKFAGEALDCQEAGLLHVSLQLSLGPGWCKCERREYFHIRIPETS
jgi:hypothetical protein